MTRPRLLAALLAVAVLGAAVVVYVLTRASYPDEWDARVQPLVEIVERERGLDFEHPVHVDFLSDKAFTEQVTADDEELSDQDREELEQTSGLMRALGFVEGDLDLFKAMNELRGGGVIGLYSYDDKRIRLRGEELTPAVRATLVHELTHALQDQHYDLEKRAEELEERNDSSASAGWQALVEGDANRVETAYTEDLSEEDKAALEKEQATARGDASGKMKDVPEFLQALLSSSYSFGEALLALAVELDGDDAVDDLFREPPVTEEHLYDPWTLLEDEQDAIEVAEPKLRKGEKEFDSGIVGSPGWLFLLAERVDLKAALRATDGWGGDAYVGFERDGRSCMRAGYRGDTEADLREMEQQLSAWVAASPAGTASVEVDGDLLTFESCDPGKDSKAGKKASNEALGLAAGRTWLAITVSRSGAPDKVARCFADALVQEFEAEDLLDPEFGANDPAVARKAQELVRGCL